MTVNIPGRYTYEFAGTATVSVTCRIEANSEAEARQMLKSGDALWELLAPLAGEGS